MQERNVVELDEYRGEGVTERAPSRDGKELPAGTQLLHGQYRITGYLDSGGFGITYRALDSLQRDVVLKECYPSILCLRAGRDVVVRKPEHAADLAAIVRQFVAEAQSLARLRHRNIVHVHQVFLENETAYIAMDFIDGLDLATVMEDHRSLLGPADIERMARRLTRAVAYTHKRGLLHRDISPDNILIDKAGEPVLIDFGAARSYGHGGEEVAHRFEFVKDGYSPPEFYDPSGRHGVWSDIYSLAATLYHLVSGEIPPSAEVRVAVTSEGGTDPCLPLTGRFGDYRPGFLEAIDAGLALDADARPASAQAWIEVLKATRSRASTALQSDPAPALAAAPGIELPSGRRRYLLGAAILALAGLGLSLWSGQEPGSRLGFGTLDAGPAPIQPAPPPRVVEVPPALAAPGVWRAPTRPVSPSGAQARRFEPAIAVETPRSVRPSQAPARQSPTTTTGDPGTTPRVLATVERPGLPASLTNTRPLSGPAPAAIPVIAPRSPALTAGSVDIGQVQPLAFVPDTAMRPAPIAAVARSWPQSGSGAHPPHADTLPAVVPGALPANRQELAIGAELAPSASAEVSLEMPFVSTARKQRNSHTVMVTSVADNADLAVSGSWIDEGVVILALNGAPLAPGRTLEAQLLDDPVVDPDGFLRASVLYRDPATRRIEQGLLAVPVATD